MCVTDRALDRWQDEAVLQRPAEETAQKEWQARIQSGRRCEARNEGMGRRLQGRRNVLCVLKAKAKQDS